MESVPNRPKGPPWWRSARYMLLLLSTLGYANFFFQRINLSMAIVCMVNHTAMDSASSIDNQHQQLETIADSQDVNTSVSPYWSSTSTTEKPKESRLDFSDTDGCTASFNNKTTQEDGDLKWDKEQAGLILGSLYWGYALCQVASQRVIQIFGCKRVALVSTLIISSFTMLGPTFAYIHHWLFMIGRVIMGVASAFGVLAMYAIWGAWAPLEERTTIVSICFSGSVIANAIVFPTSSLLCKSSIAGGWPSVFYVFGAIGFSWCILWLLFAHDMPKTHPWISEVECNYITNSVSKAGPKSTGSIPWLKILKSFPVWAIVIAQLGYNWALFLFLAVLPQYMREVLKVDITTQLCRG